MAFPVRGGARGRGGSRGRGRGRGGSGSGAGAGSYSRGRGRGRGGGRGAARGGARGGRNSRTDGPPQHAALRDLELVGSEKVVAAKQLRITRKLWDVESAERKRIDTLSTTGLQGSGDAVAASMKRRVILEMDQLRQEWEVIRRVRGVRSSAVTTGAEAAAATTTTAAGADVGAAGEDSNSDAEEVADDDSDSSDSDDDPDDSHDSAKSSSRSAGRASSGSGTISFEDRAQRVKDLTRRVCQEPVFLRELIRNPVGSRIVQTLLLYGDRDTRAHMFDVLDKGSAGKLGKASFWREMALNKYMKFVVLKAIQLCGVSAKNRVVSALLTEIPLLLLNRVSSDVVGTLYSEASTAQRTLMMKGFLGTSGLASTAIKTKLVPGATARVAAAAAADEGADEDAEADVETEAVEEPVDEEVEADRRRAVDAATYDVAGIKRLHNHVQTMMDKGITVPPLAHRVLLEFVKHASIADVQLLVYDVRDSQANAAEGDAQQPAGLYAHFLDLMHTDEGVECACILLSVVPPSMKRRILKAMRAVRVSADDAVGMGRITKGLKAGSARAIVAAVEQAGGPSGGNVDGDKESIAVAGVNPLANAFVRVAQEASGAVFLAHVLSDVDDTSHVRDLVLADLLHPNVLDHLVGRVSQKNQHHCMLPFMHLLAGAGTGTDGAVVGGERPVLGQNWLRTLQADTMPHPVTRKKDADLRRMQLLSIVGPPLMRAVARNWRALTETLWGCKLLRLTLCYAPESNPNTSRLHKRYQSPNYTGEEGARQALLDLIADACAAPLAADCGGVKESGEDGWLSMPTSLLGGYYSSRMLSALIRGEAPASWEEGATDAASPISITVARALVDVDYDMALGYCNAKSVFVIEALLRCAPSRAILLPAGAKASKHTFVKALTAAAKGKSIGATVLGTTLLTKKWTFATDPFAVKKVRLGG